MGAYGRQNAVVLIKARNAYVAAKKLYESHSGDDAMKEAYVVAKGNYLQKLDLQLELASNAYDEARGRYDDVAHTSRPVASNLRVKDDIQASIQMNAERDRDGHVHYARIQMDEKDGHVKHLQKERTSVKEDVPLRNQVNGITEVKDDNKDTFDLLCDLYERRCPNV